MIDEELADMYHVDDEESEPNEDLVKIQTKGILTEVLIAGEKIKIVNPTEVLRLIETVKTLQKRLTSTEYQVKLLEGQLRTKTKQIYDIKQELNSKISYE